ncbi:SMODS domain-containing nucleotidyltransferase [Nocardia sp. alder85J]|uniref:SMODS domain-containing nucleotidyltransferase n=1 Tax=Nocardia sp. alder85J TaxID=2862949 RepID=UPI001CD6FA03|nr:nucleotidyltransferase [Nocardia sp. alder85J]MCX4097388.1 nucleotidyltransferase [Nocardia sp. alder85J]
MDVQSYFDAFLDKISLGQKQVDRITSASDTLIDFLADRYALTTESVFLQGSYANGTAVKPVDGGEYDVDIICVCATTDQTPETALQDLFEKLESHGRYKDRLKPKQPCVRIEYADDEIGKFHVDVVPVRLCLTEADAPLDAPRKSSGWHATAPAEYTNWCIQQGEPFQRTVQMLKRWRDEHQEVRGAIKSIVLQVLIWQHLPAIAVNDAERVTQTILALHNKLSPLDSPPEVLNPVLKTENLAERWTVESFSSFKRELAEAADLVGSAGQSDDLVETVDYWRELLGDAFPAVDKDRFAIQLADMSHAESPQIHGWSESLDSRYTVAVRAWSQCGKGKQWNPYANDGAVLSAGSSLRFEADYSGPTSVDVWWRITNTGNHAKTNGSLRGNFIKAWRLDHRPSPDPAQHWERTAFTGSHLVEVFLVHADHVVARSSPYRINIRDRRFPWSA